MIHTESVWDATCVTGSYIGLTQVGPELPRSMNLSRDQFLALSAADQIQAYGKWLTYYRYLAQTARYGMNVGAQLPARQAAVLQAMQFAPNGTKWKIAFARGDYSVPSTSSRQAQFLGDTSIHDMEAYYAAFFQQHPPSYADGPQPEAAAPPLRPLQPEAVLIQGRQAAPAGFNLDAQAQPAAADGQQMAALLTLASDTHQLVAAQHVAAGVDQLRARFNANAFSGRVEGGYRFVTLGMGLAPYAAGQFTALALPAYAEQVLSGANTFALSYASKSVTAFRNEFGVRTDKSYALNDAVLTMRGRLAWAHNYDTDRNIAATFQTLPGVSFVVNGAAQARDAALTTASAEIKWVNGFSLAAAFEGEFSNVTKSYAGKGIARYSW
jgi:uncharacterized protein YhjY with autotransporter beta-barrel domain